MAVEIGILGNGGQADEAESYINGRVAFRAVDSGYITNDSETLIDITKPNDRFKCAKVIAAIGAPALRKTLVEKWPGTCYATVISDTACVDQSAQILEGSIIAPGAVITTNVEIGRHNIINVSATISHNCKLGDYVTVSPGVNIGGWVEIGEGVFIGIGAVIKDRVKIAPGVVVGAGAVVINDILKENSVVVGVPAREIRINKGWINEI
jgi:sugar O-acyltransferase (sialic acid O-acetyltransferase NeuD family)